MNKTWLENRASAEDALDDIGGGWSQLSRLRNLTAGRHNGSVISCSGTDRNLTLYVSST